MDIAVKRLDKEFEEDFYQVHNQDCCGGWCFCAAWWVPTWDGFGDRKSDQNKAVREQLFKKEIYDGYLVYINGEPIGWCQVFPRDQFPLLMEKYSLQPDPEMWAITCMSIAQQYQGMGLAHQVLSLILDDLRSRGVKCIQAFPKIEPGLPREEIWTGPLSIFVKAGFKVAKKDDHRPVLELRL